MTHDRDPVARHELVSGLLERERPVAPNSLESWRRGSDTMLEVAKKQFVGAVDSFRYVLNSLGAKVIPKSKTSGLLEFCYMLFDSIYAYAVPETLVVSLVQSNEMVVYCAGKIDSLRKTFVAF
jgi:hypothetical protein